MEQMPADDDDDARRTNGQTDRQWTDRRTDGQINYNE